jgi:hypothetical protein
LFWNTCDRSQINHLSWYDLSSKRRVDYHGQKAFEGRIDFLSIVASDPDGGCLGEGAKVVGLLHFVLGRPGDPPELIIINQIRYRNHTNIKRY